MTIGSVPNLGGLDVRDTVGIAVAAKSLNAAKREGEAMIAMLRQAEDLARQGGANAPASGAPAGRLDVLA